MHNTFALVESSVEKELKGKVTTVPVGTEVTPVSTPEVNKVDHVPISGKTCIEI